MYSVILYIIQQLYFWISNCSVNIQAENSFIHFNRHQYMRFYGNLTLIKDGNVDQVNSILRHNRQQT